MFKVTLVSCIGIIMREVEWLTQEGADLQAQTWKEVFPSHYVFINNVKVYNGGWEAEV